MRILVESYLGLGDTIETTPLCHALYLLGHDVDLYLNSADAGRMAPLFAGWPVLGWVHLHGGDIDYDAYDLGITARGRPSLHTRFPPGLHFCVHDLDVKRRNLWVTAANLEPARLLGYQGAVPPGHALSSSRDFGLPPGTVAVHAGSRTGDLRKRWMHWPRICARLQALGRHVVIVGTREDRSQDNWEDLFLPMFDLPLPDLRALLGQASFFLGNDSGVGRLAAAAGLPGLLLFGPTRHEVFQPNSAVIKTLAAGPVPATQPGSPRGAQSDINLLTVDRVWDEIKRVLADPRRDPPRLLPQRPAQPARVPARSAPVADAAGRDAYPARMLEHVFVRSADLLMQGNDRRRVARASRRDAGRAHLLQAGMLLRRQLQSMDGLKKGEIDLARDHALCAVRAGCPVQGLAVFAALWLLRRVASVRARRQAAGAGPAPLA